MTNKVYIGKIVIPKFKDEESFTIDGLHEPLILESLFYEVQDVLNGRKRPVKSKMVASDKLGLKGFLLCPECGKVLSGSASKGRSAYYHYYHCIHPCGYRLKAEQTNKAFVENLAAYTLNPLAADLFKQVLLDEYSQAESESKNDKKDLLTQISAMESRITKARELLLNGDIDGKDFKAIKTESEQKIAILESRLDESQSGYMKISEVGTLLDLVRTSLCALDTIYTKSTSYDQKRLIGSIYPENSLLTI